MPSNPLPSLTMHQLRLFLGVSQHSTLRSAAEEFELTVSTLSVHLRTVEQALGVRLLERAPGRREIRLTSSGKTFAQACQVALDSLETALSIMANEPRSEHGVVRIGCTSSFGGYILPPLYADFQTSHPEIDVEITIGRGPDLIACLRSRLLDLVILLDPLQDSTLECEELGVGIDLVLVGRPNHPLAQGPMRPFSAIASERLIVPPGSTGQRALLDRMAADLGVQLQIAGAVGSPEARIEAALRGFALVVTSAASVAEVVARGQLATLNVEGFPIRRNWFLHRRRNQVELPTSLFSAFLLQETRSRSKP